MSTPHLHYQNERRYLSAVSSGEHLKERSRILRNRERGNNGGFFSSEYRNFTRFAATVNLTSLALNHRVGRSAPLSIATEISSLFIHKQQTSMGPIEMPCKISKETVNSRVQQFNDNQVSYYAQQLANKIQKRCLLQAGQLKECEPWFQRPEVLQHFHQNTLEKHNLLNMVAQCTITFDHRL